MPTDVRIGRSAAGLAYEIAGSGTPLVLVHAGVADRRMWDPQWTAFTSRHRTIRYDARGYGETLPPAAPWAHHGDLLGLLDELAIDRAHLVGASMGAGIAAEAALARPSAVASLVLAAPGGALYPSPTDELRSIWHDEIDALDHGDLDRAVEVNLRAWVDGPVRSPDAVDAGLRAFVGRMQRDAFELPEWDPDLAPESELEPPAARRLGEIHCPTLVLVGDEDHAATRSAAEELANQVPRAELITWPDVGHMLTLERPDAFADLVLRFTAGWS